jgi:hypothetical protein
MAIESQREFGDMANREKSSLLRDENASEVARGF